MAFGRTRAEQQLFFLDTGHLFGIQSYSISPSFGDFSIKYLGIGNKSLNNTVNSPQYTDLTISSYIINEDILTQQIKTEPVNCFILKSQNDINNAYSLSSGYLTSFSAKYSPNQIPQINSTFKFFNNVGNISIPNLNPYSAYQLSGIASNSYPVFNNYIGDSNRIILTCDEYNTNRVLNFGFSININRFPIYNIGSRYVKRVDMVPPVDISCDIVFEADENFVDMQLSDYPNNKIIQNLEVDVYANQSNQLMGRYIFTNMTMVSSDREMNTDGNLTISRKYIGQLFNFVNGIISSGNPAWDFGFVANTPDFYVDWGFDNLAPTGSFDFGTL